MSWLIFAFLGLTTCSSVTLYRLQQRSLLTENDTFPKTLNILNFQRDSVESFPQDVLLNVELEKNKKINYSEFGSKVLPLRDAVEARPNIFNLQDSNGNYFNFGRQKDERIPLRDAVEHRVEPYFENTLDHESIWLEQLSPPAVRKMENEFKVVCHLDAGAIYRMEPFSLLPQAIPTRKCTHLIYNSASIDPHELTVTVRDPEYDLIKGGYKSAVGLRQSDPGLRVLISINSPDNGRMFKELFNGFDRTQKFIESVMNFLKEYEFDGVEIDWENKSNAELRILLRKLYTLFVEKGYSLALSIKPQDTVDPEIASMTHLLLFKAWRNSDDSEYAQHSAPLSFVSNLVNKWISRGVEPRKIILGIPLFGKSFTLKSSNSTSAGSAVTGPGLGGIYTNHRGTLAYYEICENLGNVWTSGRDEEGPFLKLGDQWIGYDDPISVKIKSAYVRFTELGGVSLWFLDLDDFQGICGNPWPMLNAALNGLSYSDVPVKKCSKEGLFSDPDNCSGYVSCSKGLQYHGSCGYGRFYNSDNGMCIKARPDICDPGHSNRATSITKLEELRDKQQLEQLELHQENKKVVCYVTSWAFYRRGEGKFVPEHLDSRLCTHIVYAFAGLNPDTLLIHPFDPWADIENNLYQRITSIKGPIVMLALGGWTDSSGDKYSRLVKSASSRKKFVTSTLNFLKKHNFKGLSVEWNYPKCWQSDCKRGPDSDKPNFTKLLKELRKAFDEEESGLILSVALSGYKEVIDKAYQVDEISKLVDFISVMTYDYHGAWESKTGHLAPLYSKNNTSSNINYNVNFTMKYLFALGASKEKLLMGVPMYGQSYRLSSTSHYELDNPAAGPGTPGEYTRQPGMLAYHEICNRIKKKNWKTGPAPNAYFKDQWVAYDNSKSIMEKGQYILDNGFGGATAWTVDLDDFTNRCCREPFPLLRTLNRAIGRLLTPLPSEGSCQKPNEPVTPQAPTLTTHTDALDGRPRPTKPMDSSTTTPTTTWPTWTEKPFSTIITSTPTTTWPTWTEKTSSTTERTLPTRKTTIMSTTDTIKETTTIICNSGEFMADPKNCGSYYRCILGELRREQCAPGLHWDSHRGLCDWPSSVKCQQGLATSLKPPTHKFDSSTTRRPTTTTIKSSTKYMIAKPTEKPEKDCEHGQYYSYPSSCEQFLICVNGDLIPQQCGPGLNWNEEKNMCDWAFMSPCNNALNKKAPLKIKDLSEKNCSPGSYSSVPGDCQSYRACLWGRHEIFQCAPGLHFNAETHICDWPVRAKCQDEHFLPDNILTTEASSTSTTLKPTSIAENPWTWTEPPKPTPTPAIDAEKKSPLSGYFKVVCYFTNWAWYRRGIGRYLPEHIDHTLCTHIIYGFAVLDYSDLTIKAHDSWADFDNQFYERVLKYKKRGLKISLALGGWNDSAGDKYSRLVNNQAARKKFIEHAIRFLEKFGFDGLDLDWEYPVCWQVDCRKGPVSDKQGFASLIEELSIKMKPKGLLLSAAVSPSKTVIDKGYDVPALAKYLDWIAVMTYDYHGQWDKKTGHVAPLYYHDDDEFYYFNANYSINYWISKGAPARNIVMGMPLYGQSFAINDPKVGSGLNAAASAGNAGEFTRAAGFLAYYEICDRIVNRNWTVVQDPQRRMGPYAFKGNQWVSFDDSDMIRQKAQFVRDMGLGGGMIWALDLDDFKGRCGEGPHPLMHTLQQVLSEPPNKHDKPIKLPEVGQEIEWKLPSAESTKPMNFKADTIIDDEFKLVCYFTNWAWYRQEGGRFLPEDLDPELCTHILYGFAVLDSNSLTIKSHDPWADIDNKFYERVVAFKSKGKKVLIALGGWNDSQGDKYSRLVNSPESRKKFISHAVQFIEKYNFDGLDLDWEYPVCWQVDCTKGPKADKEGFTNLVKELSQVLKPKGLLLSTAVSPSKKIINEGYDVSEISKYFDWISIMTYDFHGQWDKKTGHVAPLFTLPDDWEPTFNANFSIHYWMERGAPAKKLIMGAPLYGQSFSLAERNKRGLNEPTYGGGEAGEATRARGFLSYYEICERTLKLGWTVVQDPERRIGPFAYRGDQWVSFDDAAQIKLKAELIKKLGLGGGMVWALDLDDFQNRCECESYPLLKTMNRVLRNYPTGPTCSITGPSTEPFNPLTTTVRPITNKPISTASMISPTLDVTPDLDDAVEVVAAGKPTTTTIFPIQDCNGRLFMAHEKDCSKYLLCNFGQLSEQSCPHGLLWNEDRCDWPENTKCQNKI
ncbi:probable chitinase 10 [Leptopilina boulardi]|uniref:probable chitinase 10 n=1 Tax=Leptopilina boulardi TaxID=63433 RepID=UPI0021F516F0|nr:probable chitinase 10 [Leptopilina boulardi]